VSHIGLARTEKASHNGLVWLGMSSKDAARHSGSGWFDENWVVAWARSGSGWSVVMERKVRVWPVAESWDGWVGHVALAW